MEQTQYAPAKDVCRFVEAFYKEKGVPLDHFKLHKVLYYIQSFHLVYFDKHPLFDERPEAWVRGPVYRSIYPLYANKPPYAIIRQDDWNKKQLEEAKIGLNLSQKQWQFLESALNHYLPYSTEQLIMMTHQDAPWNEARKGLDPFEYSERVISYESMFDFYSALLKKESVNE